MDVAPTADSFDAAEHDSHGADRAWLRLRSGAAAAVILDADPVHRAYTLDAGTSALLRGGAVCLRIRNPLRAPLTLERILIQIARDETDVVIDATVAALTRTLSRWSRRVLLTIDQAETLDPAVLVMLQDLLTDSGRELESLQVVLAGDPCLHDLLHGTALAAELGPLRHMLDMMNAPSAGPRWVDRMVEQEGGVPSPGRVVSLISRQNSPFPSPLAPAGEMSVLGTPATALAEQAAAWDFMGEAAPRKEENVVRARPIPKFVPPAAIPAPRRRRVGIGGLAFILMGLLILGAGLWLLFGPDSALRTGANGLVGTWMAVILRGGVRVWDWITVVRTDLLLRLHRA